MDPVRCLWALKKYYIIYKGYLPPVKHFFYSVLKLTARWTVESSLLPINRHSCYCLMQEVSRKEIIIAKPPGNQDGFVASAITGFKIISKKVWKEEWVKNERFLRKKSWLLNCFLSRWPCSWRVLRIFSLGEFILFSAYFKNSAKKMLLRI